IDRGFTPADTLGETGAADLPYSDLIALFENRTLPDYQSAEDGALGAAACGVTTGLAAPSRKAAWDLVTRDLQAAPFRYDRQTAFVIGSKLLHQGSGNIAAWHSGSCDTATAGCGAGSAYLQWLAADDDNGDLTDGTPHMTALFNAFDRQGIACPALDLQDSGCAGGPAGAVALTGRSGKGGPELAWNETAGAARYWVFRSEAAAGCDAAGTLVGETAGTSFTDAGAPAGGYSYQVVPAGTASACVGPVSNCTAPVFLEPNMPIDPIEPIDPAPDYSVSCSPASLTIQQGGSGTVTCTVTSFDGFSSAVAFSCSAMPTGGSCAFSPSSVTPPADGTASTTVTISATGTAAAGTSTIKVDGKVGTLTRTAGVSLTISSSPPDFTVSCGTSSISVQQGGSVTRVCTIASVGGFASAVSMSCVGLAAGESCSFSPASVTPAANGTASTTMTLSASSTATAGTDAFSVRGTSGTLVNSDAMSLTVTTPPPTFALSCTPTSLSVLQGGTDTSTCTVTSQNGFASAVSLACSALPSGASCSFSPASVTPAANGTATTTLTVSASSTATVGASTIKVDATSSTLAKTVGLSLTITAPQPTFSIACSPSTLTLEQGGIGARNCTVTSVNGFASPVSLSCSALPAGVGCSFSPASVTPAANGTATTTVTVTASSTATTGTSTIKIDGTSGTMTKTAGISLTVDPPQADFSLACSPTSLSIAQGSPGSTSCTVTSHNGFNSAVDFSCTGLPAGVTCLASPDPVTPAANGTVTSTVTFSASSTAAAGTTTVQVKGTSGTLIRTVGVAVTVSASATPDFTVSCTPASLTVQRGGSTTSTCKVTSLNSFASAVSFACSALPAGVSCSFSPASVTPAANGTANTTVTITASSTATVGTATIKVDGTSGTKTRTGGINLTVTSPPTGDFSVSCSSTTLSIPMGTSKSRLCTITSLSGFSSAVGMSCSGLPAGATCSFSPATVTPAANGSVSSTVTINSGSAAEGTYAITIKGTSGSTVRSTTLNVSIYEPLIVGGCLGTSPTQPCQATNENPGDKGSTSRQQPGTDLQKN
ncbi:MAG TPA: hypothetical protein VHU81_02815, partial [Thermoanaerobaculia bacterium]|nr:hypothetical protein [Thermoanaerobaculia bacterium]